MILAEATPDSEFQWFAAHLGHQTFVIVALVLSALLLITRVIEGSEKVAKYVPLIGKRLRARHALKEEARRKIAREEAEAAIAALEPPDYARRVDHLEQSNTKLEERLDVLEMKDDVAHAFHIFDESWHREDELERVENGQPIRPRLTFREFAARYYAGERYRGGIWVKP